VVGGSDRGWNEIGEGVEGNRRKGGREQEKGWNETGERDERE